MFGRDQVEIRVTESVLEFLREREQVRRITHVRQEGQATLLLFSVEVHAVGREEREGEILLYDGWD